MPTTGPEPEVVEVGVGVCWRDGCTLIARRMPHQHLAGYWEFPGGKREPGESLRQAMERELHEELDVRVRVAEPLVVIQHDYPDKRVALHCWLVTGFSGVPRGRDGQEIRWVEPDRLAEFSFPEANRRILDALCARVCG